MKNKQYEHFSEDRHGITYREDVEPLISLGIAAFSLVFFLVAILFLFELLSWPWHGGKVMGLLTVLAFIGGSVFGLLLAFAGVRPQHLRFDAETRRVHGRARSRLWLLRSLDASFGSLQQPDIRAIEQESGGDLYEVRVTRAGHLPIGLGAYEKRSDAEYWRSRLSRLLKT